jgi:hypothetical protein
LNSTGIKYFDHDGYTRFENATITLPNIRFDCGGKAINRDFHKLLKTEEHPQIDITLKQISLDASDDSLVNAKVDIDICDVRRTYEIPIEVAQKDNLVVSGVLPLNINDFNLSPPSKLFGIIKVEPEIKIDFFFSLQMEE